MPVVVADIQSELLAGNPLGDPAERRVPVYLPPDYETSGTDYPVVYFLAGFSGGGTLLLGESLWGENLVQRLDRLLAAGAIRPMIVVMPDCITRFGGSQYINSAATGRYEDHLTRELIPFIDATFRTRARRESRCVMGKSSGGYGASVLAMRHPDLFGLAVDHSGDKYFDLCHRADMPRCVAGLARYDHSVERFLAEFPHRPEERGRDWFTVVNMLAMSSCYSPNPTSPGGFDLPFDPYTGEIRNEVWQRWLEHDPVHLAARYADALGSLRLYLLDCGRHDEHHLQLGGRIYARRLADLSIPHTYEEFEGGHMNVSHRYDLSLGAVSRAFAESC
jgi:S-formylglutathione hydrolase FrmB